MDSLSIPLHEAVKAENIEEVKALILNGAEKKIDLISRDFCDAEYKNIFRSENRGS